MATDGWADVQIAIDSQCEGEREGNYLVGRGVVYSSVSDHLVFRGYWPWTPGEYSSRIVYDSQGMTSNILPCPHALSAEQINELRIVAQEALSHATTDAEERVLSRVGQRLAETTGGALASAQEGCTDQSLDYNVRSYPSRYDPWN